MIDVGGYSSRPDAAEVTPEREWRGKGGIGYTAEGLSRPAVSVDTFTASAGTQVGGGGRCRYDQ